MSEEKKCPICGEPTYLVYGKHPRKDGLCKKHSQMLFNGELAKCSDCGEWYEPLFGCDCKLPENNITINNKKEKNEKQIDQEQIDQEKKQASEIQTIIIDKGFKCLTCGYETDGKLFCKKCYSKYYNKEILIKVKNCKEIVPLDDFYEGYFECDDGHVVKSMAERDIDDYLFEKNIKHGYEIPLPLTDDKGKKVTLHPDFCIFDENGKPLYYIEYWGYDDSNRDYTKTKKFKMPLYKKARITLININAKYDIRNLKINLKFKLENYKIGQCNFENE